MCVGLFFTAPTTFHAASIPEASFSLKEWTCLAQNIHYEAKGESKLGKIAVGHVTINRTKSKVFPETICKVVNQPGQFSWVNKVRVNMQAIPTSTKQLAYDLLSGKYKVDPTFGALYFHNIHLDGFARKQTVVINNHVFYK